MFLSTNIYNKKNNKNDKISKPSPLLNNQEKCIQLLKYVNVTNDLKPSKLFLVYS